MEEEKQEQEIKEEEVQSAETENKELNNKADEIIKLKQELEEKDDRLKRLMAEFENYKKRSGKEREFLYGSILKALTQKSSPFWSSILTHPTPVIIEISSSIHLIRVLEFDSSFCLKSALWWPSFLVSG